MNSNSDNTPIPGRILANPIAAPIIAKFKKKFRNETTYATNIPTACTIQGIKANQILDAPFFSSPRNIYALYEQPPVLRETSTKAMRDYLRSRQPWEDYDVCLFDSDMKWAIGISHNGHIIVSDKDNILM